MVVSFLVGVIAGGYAVSRATQRQRSDTSMTENLRVMAAERVEEFAEVVEGWLEEVKNGIGGRIRAVATAIRPAAARSPSGAGAARTLRESDWESR